LPYGVLLLGARLEILEASAPARRLLASRSILHADEGHLGFLRSSDQRAFAERLSEDPVRAARHDAIVFSRGPLRSPLSLLVLPLKSSQEPWLRPAARWLVIFLDPENAPLLNEHALQRAFRITAAEAALAGKLASGLTVTQAAAELEISRNTARSQLKSVFAKIGVHTQAQLVQRILSGPASLGV
jgi:DNA-binding CsgD family transcriptional regulator